MKKLVLGALTPLAVVVSLQACSGGSGEEMGLGGEGGAPASGGNGSGNSTGAGGEGATEGGAGDAGAGGQGPGGQGSGDQVLDALAAFGVDVEDTPRLGDDKQPLPDDYAPLGASRSFDTIEELVFLGARLQGADSLLTVYELQSQDDRPIYERENYFAPSPTDTPWAGSVGESPNLLRDAAAADIDGDGLDELVVLSRSELDGTVRLLTYQESSQAGVVEFAEDQELTLSEEEATDLALAAGDLNGDGLAEFVVGLALDSGAELLFLENEGGRLALVPLSTPLPQITPGSEIALSLATGNLDDDAGAEVVVVVNELSQTTDGDKGTSRFYIKEDAKADFADVKSGPIRASLDAINRTAVVADVSIGNIDSDQAEEVVFGGLQGFDPSGTCSYRYLLVALDDNKHDNLPLSGQELVPEIHGGCATTDPGKLRYVHVNVLDLDGDGLVEVQANQYLFHDFVNHEPWSRYQWGIDENENPLYATIDDASLFASTDGGFSGRFANDNSTMIVGDVTADGRQNVVFYSQATNSLETWGLSNPDDGSPPLTGPIFAKDWRKMNTLAVEDPGTEPAHPVLLPSNVNHDSLAIRFSEGQYRLVFTEPIVIAALAAPPCGTGFGQEDDSCRTSFGTTSSVTVSKEEVVSVNASVTVGFEAEFSAFGIKTIGLEVLGTVSGEAGQIKSEAYTVSKSIAYTTGALQDTVILTTVPLDQYTYEVTSHPDPELIGAQIVISLPREPIDVQVERERYNDNVVKGGPLIGSEVLAHVLGNPKSYPSPEEKDELLEEYVGFDNGPAAVGNSGGGTELSINVASESGTGQSYGASFELSVQASAGGVVGGFSVGASKESSLQIVHGTESTYSGFVADMDVPTADFGRDRYSWGMFTYVYDDPISGQQYEVINYWVE